LPVHPRAKAPGFLGTHFIILEALYSSGKSDLPYGSITLISLE